MSALRFFGFTYFLGLAIFLLVVLVVVLAVFGVETIGRSLPLVYPIAASVILIAASKIALGVVVRWAEKSNG